jgi:hypothetical protein
MSLANIYLELLRRARETGDDRATTLRGGARLAVRCQDAVITLTISRVTKPLGATEIEVFKRDLGIPAHAIRFPQEGQNSIARDGATWHYIAYRFCEEQQS